MDFTTLKRIQDAMDIIRSGGLDDLECGRYEFSDGIYANVFQYDTKDSSIFEAHRRYIDIHYLISGEEFIELADVNSMTVTKEYDEAGDAVLGTATGKRYLMKQGQSMVVWPEEAHMPGIKVGETVNVKKAVVKVPI